MVVTAPLGWLKKNRAAFTPALPTNLSTAIDNISYGNLDKVYITFPSAFWDEPGSVSVSQASGAGMDPDGKTPNVKAKSMPLHQPVSSLSTPRYYPSSSLWLSPSYATGTNPECWSQEALNLAALGPSCAHPTLLFYIYGDCSKHIARLASSSNSEKERNARISEFFQPYYSLLPNYDSDRPACKPIGVLATAWAMDEFAGYGSYSNFQVGIEQANMDIETMRRGVPERGIWLAGEHTAPFVALGTTTGAYMSGQKAAERILAAHKISSRIV